MLTMKHSAMIREEESCKDVMAVEVVFQISENNNYSLNGVRQIAISH